MFFGALPPQKLVYIGASGAFISLAEGRRIPEMREGGVRSQPPPPPPPLNLLLIIRHALLENKIKNQEKQNHFYLYFFIKDKLF